MKKYGLMAVLLAGLGFACQREGNFPEVTNMPVEQSESGEKKPIAAGILLGQMIFDSVAYEVPQEKMLQPFIKEFGDGTVVDVAMIKRVQATKKDKPYYYVVGIGQKNGDFRMMALELYASEDNSLYVTSKSRKYISTSNDCDFCMFTYDKNVITGAECQSRDATTECTYAVEESNTFMR
ncbi:hypothetical protein [Adhaeribacter soli]|uniref:Lipoprotein n=1 Tax=Adhaeribacter soli TaxID=2607655 RepID=A0A5N1IXD8_9BACT|nr:hypothetical protein [Adhaeribacter soli]KAA9332723.1 hypothetical protein F0P94_12000 [Adhaeribacter soli]